MNAGQVDDTTAGAKRIADETIARAEQESRLPLLVHESITSAGC